MSDTASEQEARNLLARLGIANAHRWASGEIAELANLIAERVALRRERHALREDLKEMTGYRDGWKATAIALGVKGEATRDTSRNLLTLSMRVDEGVLRLGKADVLTATFRKMRDQYERAIAQPVSEGNANG